jgi:hypothetical protein
VTAERYDAEFDTMCDLLEIMPDTITFHVNGTGKPGFMIFPHPHFHSGNKAIVLFMNHVGLIGCYPTRKKAEIRLQEIIEKANYPVRVYRKYHGRIQMFAENTVKRKPDPLPESAGQKVFEIPEWRECKP